MLYLLRCHVHKSVAFHVCIHVFPLISYSIGENVKILVNRPDGSYCFRLHKERVYYVRSVVVYKSVA